MEDLPKSNIFIHRIKISYTNATSNTPEPKENIIVDYFTNNLDEEVLIELVKNYIKKSSSFE